MYQGLPLLSLIEVSYPEISDLAFLRVCLIQLGQRRQNAGNEYNYCNVPHGTRT